MQGQVDISLQTIEALGLCGCLPSDEKMIDDGFMADTTALETFINQCTALHNAPEATDLRWSLGADDDVLDVNFRHNEFISWLDWLISSHRLNAAIVSAK